MEVSYSASLAAICADFAQMPLPDPVIRETKRLIFDTIGCGLGGHAVEKGRLAARFTQSNGGTGAATVLGLRGKFPATAAAFANGELMHALDWCSVQPPSHVPTYVLPPLLALAESRHLSGKALIAAMALACEVTGRVGQSIGSLRATPGGFPRRVWGISTNQLGATAGAGLLLGFDADQMLHALGASAYYAPLATHVKYNHTIEVGYAKYGPSGWMAQGALTTALLTEMGHRGDTSFLDGPHGFAAQNGALDWEPDRIFADWGQDWVFLSLGYKKWPVNGMNQSSIDVFIDLIEEHGLQPDEIDEVTMSIEAFAGLPKYVNTTPNDHVEAASSGPYSLAVAAHRIPRGPQWQADGLWHDPKIRAFMAKVRHAVNPKSEPLRARDLEEERRHYLRHRPAHIRILARGRVFEGETDFAAWLSVDPDHAPSDAELAQKFRENAAGRIAPDKVERAIEALWDLENCMDVAAVMTLLQGESEGVTHG